jgi:hypothetical protein
MRGAAAWRALVKDPRFLHKIRAVSPSRRAPRFAIETNTSGTEPSVPSGATLGTSLARFRIRTNLHEANTSFGSAPGGEVEDCVGIIANRSSNADLGALATAAANFALGAPFILIRVQI